MQESPDTILNGIENEYELNGVTIFNQTVWQEGKIVQKLRPDMHGRPVFIKNYDDVEELDNMIEFDYRENKAIYTKIINDPGFRLPVTAERILVDIQTGDILSQDIYKGQSVNGHLLNWHVDEENSYKPSLFRKGQSVIPYGPGF